MVWQEHNNALCSLETPDPPTDRLTEWEEWTACSKSCGRGAQARKRECMIAENGTSVYCVGEKIQVQDCNAQPCLGMNLQQTLLCTSTCTSREMPGEPC